jgi:hypothetical protein
MDTETPRMQHEVEKSTRFCSATLTRRNGQLKRNAGGIIQSNEMTIAARSGNVTCQKVVLRTDLETDASIGLSKCTATRDHAMCGGSRWCGNRTG